MNRLIRFGVSLDSGLLEKFDSYTKTNNYSNRSKAIADLIRGVFVEQEWAQGKSVAGAIMIVYDHHKRELVNKLVNIQHDFQDTIISSQHVHLDHDNCLEIIIVKGKTTSIKKLASMLKAEKGVKYSSLTAATTGKHL